MNYTGWQYCVATTSHWLGFGTSGSRWATTVVLPRQWQNIPNLIQREVFTPQNCHPVKFVLSKFQIKVPNRTLRFACIQKFSTLLVQVPSCGLTKFCEWFTLLCRYRGLICPPMNVRRRLMRLYAFGTNTMTISYTSWQAVWLKPTKMKLISLTDYNYA